MYIELHKRTYSIPIGGVIMNNREDYINSEYITDNEALAIFGEEYGKVGHFEKAKAKELELYAREHPEFDRELVNMATVLYLISSGKKAYELTTTDINLIKNNAVYITDKEALEIFGEEYNRAGHSEKVTAKELEYYARTHPRFDRKLVNMTTVIYILSSGKKPYELTSADIKIINWTDKHNLRNGKGPITKLSNKLRKKFPMEYTQELGYIIFVIFLFIFILIKIL